MDKTSDSQVIRILNPKINGWGNFYRHSVASKTFGYVENQIFQSLYAWSIRRHPDKGKRWVVNKYFMIPVTAPEWKFHGVSIVGGVPIYQSLKAMDKISIKRHVKVKCDANPYDRDYVEYFQKRSITCQLGRNTWVEMLPTAL